ncbi:MAG TPA: flagellar basal body P-ring formation chaperone FlgA [Spongiibacteraceae bacterium]|nr:flagellar basal body P-ring formation chaperone FlgA [Spongiibacteraceae bacterium]
MRVRNFLRICHIVCAVLLVVPQANAQATANPAVAHGPGVDIDKFMTGYARDLTKRLGPGSRVEYSTPSLSGSAATRSCPVPLAISNRDQTQSLSRVTLLVACGKEWSIYLPVDLDVYRPVVVALKPLATGSIVNADDVQLSTLNVSQLIGAYITTLDEAVGMSVKRPIAQGRPIVSQQLDQPILVRRGESVVISAESGDLAVKMSGVAMSDGRRGEQIRVKNQTSSRVVDARVVAPGQVTVPM